MRRYETQSKDLYEHAIRLASPFCSDASTPCATIPFTVQANDVWHPRSAIRMPESAMLRAALPRQSSRSWQDLLFAPHAPDPDSNPSPTQIVTQASGFCVIFRPLGLISNAESTISSRLARKENMRHNNTKLSCY